MAPVNINYRLAQAPFDKIKIYMLAVGGEGQWVVLEVLFSLHVLYREALIHIETHIDSHRNKTWPNAGVPFFLVHIISNVFVRLRLLRDWEACQRECGKMSSSIKHYS